MLIYHRFPSFQAAVGFAVAISFASPRDLSVWTDAHRAATHAMFPYELEQPIVLVERREDLGYEDELERLAEAFGGRFAGT